MSECVDFCDTQLHYKVGDPIHPETTGLSATRLDAPLPEFQVGDRVYFGGDRFTSTPIWTNSIRGVLTALSELAKSTVSPMRMDEQKDQDVLLTLGSCTRAAKRTAMRKWRRGTLTYHDLLFDQDYVSGPLCRDYYTGRWRLHFR